MIKPDYLASTYRPESSVCCSREVLLMVQNKVVEVKAIEFGTGRVVTFTYTVPRGKVSGKRRGC